MVYWQFSMKQEPKSPEFGERRLTITPSARPRMGLEELLEGIPLASRIAEVDWGKPAGREEW